MGLESVVGDIQEKGRREAEAIRAETQREIDQILQVAQSKVETIKLAADRDVAEQIAKMSNQEVSAANLVVKRRVLNAEKEVLDQVYKTTLASLAKLPESFHREVLERLLQQASTEVKQGTVFSNGRDDPIVQQLIAGNPAYSGYRMGKPVEIEGGIVVESTDGGMKLDLSYRTFLDRVWESGLKDASDILFA
jgi:V/A-type H+-transporting ATPase subunit E